ncbi:MAG: glutamate 5-kinase [Geminicoccaceae bacterium]
MIENPLKLLDRAKRVTIKVGSSLLVDRAGGLRRDWLDGLTMDIAALRRQGSEVIVVSSGAIGLGRHRLGLPAGPLKLEEKQAAAASGQIALAAAYDRALDAKGLHTAQLLLTIDDTEDRRRYLNARSTMGTLLRIGAVPVVNENDTVATTEIRFGDNDRLSARVAVMATCDLLVLLSDVDGLFASDPRQNPAAPFIAHVPQIDAEIEAMAGGVGSAVGTGGMATKIEAARIATRSGCAVLLANGGYRQPLARLREGHRCTLFEAGRDPSGARKAWIAGSLAVNGVVHVDDGAARALKAGRSLLPAGVTGIEGAFERGDAVLVKAAHGEDLAKGLVAYDVGEARMIAGRRSEDIDLLLGYRRGNALIHRDDMVLL